MRPKKFGANKKYEAGVKEGLDKKERKLFYFWNRNRKGEKQQEEKKGTSKNHGWRTTKERIQGTREYIGVQKDTNGGSI